ncbi:MAG: phosphotransferase enzyme family protein [Halioglobus sp.]
MDIFPGCSFKKSTGDSAPKGFYRVTDTRNTHIYFVKIVSTEDANHFLKTKPLLQNLSNKGVSVNLPARECADFDSDHKILCFDWLDDQFYDESIEQLLRLSRALSQLHEILASYGKTRSNESLVVMYFHSLRELKERSPSQDTEIIINNLLGKESRILSTHSNCVQYLHNDLHRGNILFSKDKTIIFLDFEECLTSFGNPILDISWVVERFILCRQAQEPSQNFLFEAFFNEYTFQNNRVSPELWRKILDAIQLRALFTLNLIYNEKDKGNTIVESEIDKFFQILKLAERKRKTLD